MTTSNSIASTSREIMWIGALLLAASAVACGGTTQSLLGTAPSGVSAVASAPDAGGTFATLKEGGGKGKDSSGKGPDHGGAPTTGTEPTTGGTPDADGPETGDGHGHGHAPEPDDDHGKGNPMTQIEGFTTSIAGTCPALTIEINGLTVTTDATTDFQRADCAELAPAAPITPPAGTPTAGTTPTSGTADTTGTTPTTTPTVPPAPAASFHVHITAKADVTGNLVASYVRVQGGDGTGDDDITTPPPTGTTPTN